MENSSIPHHIAVIMDGNGRWAKAKGLPRTAGHKKGADALRTMMNTCRDQGVRYLTTYAFSSENWKRPADEVRDLMKLLLYYLRHELQTLHKNRIRIRFIGDRAPVPADIRDEMTQAEALTCNHTDFHFTVALSYGGRQEIVQAAQLLARRVASGQLQPDAIGEALFSSSLYTHGLPDPDLLIRTGGEQRLSNFLLWQLAYTELYFTPVLWPDFSAHDLKEACHAFTKRERRYGNAQ